jgi:transposase
MTPSTREKKRRERWIAWAEAQPREVLLVWEDECWFSRFAQPRLKGWGQMRLQQRMVLPRTPDKALSYYGIKRHDTGQIYLYPCWQRPNSDETLQFLRWIVCGAALLGKKVVIVIWDNASWHVARKVKRWIRRYNQQAKGQPQKPRLIVWSLPKRSPWLNPIEPHWLHAKKRIFEPSTADLSPHRLRQRVFQALNAKFIASLSQPLL